MRRSLVRLLGILVVLGCGGVASAGPITYIWTGTATGRLGNNPFDGATFTIESLADTSGITLLAPGIFYNTPSVSTITIQGLGTATFTGADIRNVINQNIPAIGISDFVQGLAILFVENDALGTYGMASAIGPLPGPPGFNDADIYETTAGGLLLESVSNASFEARVGAVPVPEPATIATAAVGVIGLVMARRRQSSRMAA